MGGRLSKPDGDEPQLYAVATPHPTLQYIYPVYAAPADLSRRDNKPKRLASPTRSWRSDKSKKSKKRKGIKVIGEQDADVYLAPAQSDNGAWYCYHVDNSGHVDYVEPGTAVPGQMNPAEQVPQYLPQYNAQPEYTAAPASGLPYAIAPYHYAQAQAQYGQPQYTAGGSSSSSVPHHSHMHARSASPRRARSTSPAPSYQRAASPSMSATSYGRTVTPVLGLRTAPSPAYHRGTPYPFHPPPPSSAPPMSSASRSAYQQSETDTIAESEITSSPSAFGFNRQHLGSGAINPSPPSEMSLPSTLPNNPLPKPPQDLLLQAQREYQPRA